MNIGEWFKSKTVWGAILTAGAWLLGQSHIDPVSIVQAIGSVVAVIGARDAIAKAGAAAASSVTIVPAAGASAQPAGVSASFTPQPPPPLKRVGP